MNGTSARRGTLILNLSFVISQRIFEARKQFAERNQRNKSDFLSEEKEIVKNADE